MALWNCCGKATSHDMSGRAANWLAVMHSNVSQQCWSIFCRVTFVNRLTGLLILFTSWLFFLPLTYIISCETLNRLMDAILSNESD